MTPGPYDDLIPKAAPVSTAGPYDDLIPKPDTAQRAEDGSRIFNPNVEPWKSAPESGDTNTTAQQALNVPANASPSLWERAKAMGRSLLPQPGESVAGAVGRDALGLAKGVVQPFATIAREGAYQAADPGHYGIKLPFIDRPTNQEMATAAPQALAGVLLPGASAEASALASPLKRIGAKLALDAGVGAVYNPDDPALGAAIGGGLGAIHAGVKALPAIPNLRNAAVEALSPGLTERARLGQVAKAAQDDYAAQRAEYDRLHAQNPVQGPAVPLAPVQQAMEASAPRADAILDHADILRTIKAGWDATGPAPYDDLVPKEVAQPATEPQITVHDNTVSGVAPARDTGPVAHDAGAGDAPVPARGVAVTATVEPHPATPDLGTQPALADQHAAAARVTINADGSDQEGRMPWNDGYGTAAPYVPPAPSEAPRDLATRDAKGNLKRNLKNVPIDDLHQEYSDLVDRMNANPQAIAPFARQTEYGTTVTGHTRGLWAVNSMQKAADRIRAEVQRRGGDVEYRNAGIYADLSNPIKHALDRPYPGVETGDPRDLEVRNNLLAAGAGTTHGMDVAVHGGNYITAGLDPKDVQHIGDKLTADNLEMVAAARRAAGDHGAADKAEQQAALYLKDVPAGIEHTPAYQTYVSRYREVYEPHYNETSNKTGVPEENFRDVKPGSVYVPLIQAQEAEAAGKVVRSRANGNRTQLSSAAKTAMGTGDYLRSPTEAAQVRMPEVTRKAAQNDLWQSVRSRGRELTASSAQSAREGLTDGESLIAFTDKNQLTTPESETAAHYVAVPDHVAKAVQQFVDRRDAPKLAGGLNRTLTTASAVASPAIGLTHGSSIAQTVNMISGGSTAGEVARTLASVAPMGNTIAGVVDMNRVDMTDPATLKNYLAISKYGGSRPLYIPRGEPGLLKRIAGKVHSDLFGAKGMDVRGRAVAANRLLTGDAHPAEVAQQLGQAFGQYNTLNQPGVVYTGQRTGLTSFAPAGIGFTTEAVKRVTGQRGVGPMVKSLAAPVAGAVGLNYALSGHSPLSNAQGHRGDIDLGYQKDGQEQFLKASYSYPLTNRALNTTGASALIEGEGASGVASSVVNEGLQQLGVVPRMLAALGNAQLREKSSYDGFEPLVPPQFGESNRFLRIAQQAGAPFIGAAGGVGGFSNFDSNQPFKSRVLNAVHANAVASGSVIPRTNNDVKAQGYQDKLTEGMSEIGRADDKQAKMQELLARAKSDGYTPIQMMLMQKQWLRAAAMSNAVKGQLHQKAIAKKGFLPSATP